MMGPAPRRAKAWGSATPASGSRRYTERGRASIWGDRRKAEPRPQSGCHIMSDIRALIVDDEPLARRGIRQLLAPYADIEVVGECRDGSEAVRGLAMLRPDLVFLDVQMPGLDGMGVVRIHGAERMPGTVFVTAHDEFPVRAFEAQD